MKLSNLGPGATGKVKKVHGPLHILQRMLSMGLVPGSKVKVEKVAPLGDPVDVLVEGYHLSLRKDEAELIEVEVIL